MADRHPEGVVPQENQPGCDVKLSPVRRVGIVIGLLVSLAATAAGCSTSATRSDLRVCRPAGPGQAITKTGAPLPPSCLPTTTTTPLPAALPLGMPDTVAYTVGSGNDAEYVSGRFVINRIWTDATPQLVDGIYTVPPPPGWTLSQAVGALFRGAHLSPEQQVTWVGVDLALTNTGTVPIELGGQDGSGVIGLYFVVNGHSPLTGGAASLTQSGFDVGVPTCQYPFPRGGGLNPGESVSGCVALAVPVGVKVSDVGFALTENLGTIQWAA